MVAIRMPEFSWYAVGTFMPPNDHESWIDVKGYNHIHRFKFDTTDLSKVARHKWYFHKGNRSVVAKALIDGKWVKLHRFLIDAPRGVEVDHKNRDPYDCTRKNLKLTDRFHQERNKVAMRRSSTGMRGVIPRRGMFEARIQFKGQRKYIGTFDAAWKARLAYMIEEWAILQQLNNGI